MLFEKIHGCNAAVNVSNSMGDLTEGNSWQVIEQKFGFVDELRAQDKPGSSKPRPWGPPWVRHAHHRPPGMGEDGLERHRLACTAVIEKGGRIDLWDLARVWLRDIDPDKFGYLLGNQDRIFYDLLAAGVHPAETGRHAVWPGKIGTAKMMLPVGIANAGRPDNAARDARQLGLLKDSPGRTGNFALDVCAALAAGCAEALRPAATVESVIDEALQHLSEEPAALAREALDWADDADEVWDIRPLFAERWIRRPANDAHEVFAAGLAIFRKTDAQTRDCIIAAVNFGGDCDCISHVCAGLAGALRGIDSIPADWVRTIEEQLPDDPYTVSRRSLADTARGLHQAALAELRKARQHADQFR